MALPVFTTLYKINGKQNNTIQLQTKGLEGSGRESLQSNFSYSIASESKPYHARL